MDLSPGVDLNPGGEKSGRGGFKSGRGEVRAGWRRARVTHYVIAVGSVSFGGPDGFTVVGPFHADSTPPAGRKILMDLAIHHCDTWCALAICATLFASVRCSSPLAPSVHVSGYVITVGSANFCALLAPSEPRLQRPQDQKRKPIAMEHSFCHRSHYEY